jgi:hypothetical protein
MSLMWHGARRGPMTAKIKQAGGINNEHLRLHRKSSQGCKERI